MPQDTKSLIAQLSALKFSFSRSDAGLKADLIEALSKRKVAPAASLIEYHETLCFMQAYPDDKRISQLVDRELTEFMGRVDEFKRRNLASIALDDTGMAGTMINYPYNLFMARWLVENHGAAVDIDWDDYNEKSGDPLSGILPLLALYPENDGIDDEDLATTDWIKLAGGKRNSLRWLIERLDSLEISPDVRNYIYDNSELSLKWRLGSTKCARTLAKIPPEYISYQRRPLKKERIDLHRSVRRAAPELKLLPREIALETIQTLIRALLPRHRELYPATFANPDEVYVTTPGRGLDIYILGMLPTRRMPLESNYSALLVKNGVPIGYGISVVFFDRCEIAINVFDSFRAGEAGMIFEHFVRLFYHHFGARDFLMRRWQVGYENEEGIKSGSFWFYYKLGLRSLDLKIDEMASQEWQKISSDRGYRTSAKTLKRLARSDMHISPGNINRKAYSELAVTKLGFAVTKMVAEKFAGDRQAALEWSISKVKRAGISSANLNRLEKIQYRRFSPLLALIDDLDNWTAGEKSLLLRVIRAKAASREIEYIRLLQKHSRFKAALEKLAL